MARVTGMDEVRAALEDGVKRALTAAGMVAVEATQEQMMSGYGAPIWDTGATIQPVHYEVDFGLSL